MDASEAAWLEAVSAALERTVGLEAEAMGDEEKRLLLRATKVTAEATGVRYLAPLTAYLIGCAAGRAGRSGSSFDLRRAADAVSEVAAGWPRPPEG